jgi:hypothetical protein
VALAVVARQQQATPLAGQEQQTLVAVAVAVVLLVVTAAQAAQAVPVLSLFVFAQRNQSTIR